MFIRFIMVVKKIIFKCAFIDPALLSFFSKDFDFFAVNLKGKLRNLLSKQFFLRLCSGLKSKKMFLTKIREKLEKSFFRVVI